MSMYICTDHFLLHSYFFDIRIGGRSKHVLMNGCWVMQDLAASALSHPVSPVALKA